VNVEAVTTFGGPLCQCGYDGLSTHGHLGIVDVVVAVAVAVPLIVAVAVAVTVVAACIDIINKCPSSKRSKSCCNAVVRCCRCCAVHHSASFRATS